MKWELIHQNVVNDNELSVFRDVTHSSIHTKSDNRHVSYSSYYELLLKLKGLMKGCVELWKKYRQLLRCLHLQFKKFVRNYLAIFAINWIKMCVTWVIKKITKIIESSEIFNLHNVGVVGLPSSLYDIHQRTDGNLCFTLVRIHNMQLMPG